MKRKSGEEIGGTPLHKGMKRKFGEEIGETPLHKGDEAEIWRGNRRDPAS
ncbi:MAG: hypothetical protein ACQEXB_20645 [Bacillota bacterium]